MYYWSFLLSFTILQDNLPHFFPQLQSTNCMTVIYESPQGVLDEFHMGTLPLRAPVATPV